MAGQGTTVSVSTTSVDAKYYSSQWSSAAERKLITLLSQVTAEHGESRKTLKSNRKWTKKKLVQWGRVEGVEGLAVWRRAVRCAAGAGFQHELPPLLKEMKLTDIRHRWIVQYLTFTRRCHIRSAPPTACAKLSSTSHCHATRGNAHSYRPFRASRQAGSVSFSNRALPCFQPRLC